MSTDLRYPDKYKSTLIFFVVVSSLLGVSICIFGEFVMPVAAAFMAVLMLFEKKHLFSIAVPLFTILINLIIDFAFGGKYSLVGVETAILAFLIFIMFYFGRSKAECAIVATVFISILTFASFLLEACYHVGEFSWSAVEAYYGDLYDSIKDLLIEQMRTVSELINSNNAGNVVQLGEDAIVAMLDSIVAIIPSLIVVTSFALAGVTFKIFSALVFKHAYDRLPILRWRFRSTSLIAYFYFALVAVGFFAGGATDIAALVINNLYNIFLYVFAYLGVVYIFNILANVRSRGFAIGMIAIAFVAFGTMAALLFSIVGAFFTIKENGFLNSKGDDSRA